MAHSTTYRIFKTRSRTFFVSSLFFPAALRDEVFTFYSFVRTADDFVDTIPPKREEFFSFKQRFEDAYHKQARANNPLIDEFVALMHEREIPFAWIASFFAAMEADLTKKTYATLAELETYMYGSAEVIGLVMAKLMNLPSDSYSAAQCLGRAFQYINFIRDLAEDTQLGRQYIPTECLAHHNLTHLSRSDITHQQQNFRELVQTELSRYRSWQAEGERGFAYIPRRFRIPIKTAADLYRSTAKKIASDPFIILDHAIKPSLVRILGTLSKNLLVA